MAGEKFAIVMIPVEDLPKGDQFSRNLTLWTEVCLEIENYLGEKRTQRVTHQNDMEAVLTDALSTESQKSAAIRTYEERYNSSGRSKALLLNKLRTMCQRKGQDLEVVTIEPNVEEIRITAQRTFGNIGYLGTVDTIPVARMYYGAKRFNSFLPVGKPEYIVNEVFKHKETGYHYVQDCRGHFIRRFQWRAVNEEDRERIDNDNAPDILAKIRVAEAEQNKATGKEGFNYTDMVKKGDSLGNEVFNTRKVFFQLQKGSQRYISITSTKYNIYGNTGTSFEQNGFIVIDLGRIKKDKVLDVHQKGALMGAIGMGEWEYDRSLGNGTKSDKQRAARDTLRTREILVHGFIPKKAIIYVSWEPDNVNKSPGKDNVHIAHLI